MAQPRLIDMADLRPRLQRAIDTAAQKVGTTIERYPDFFPIYTQDGSWKHQGELWTDWCAGFHAGLMWILERRIGHPWWREKAEHFSRLIEYKKHDRDVHDLGFIFLNTYLPWYRLTGDRALNDTNRPSSVSPTMPRSWRGRSSSAAPASTVCQMPTVSSSARQAAAPQYVFVWIILRIVAPPHFPSAVISCRRRRATSATDDVLHVASDCSRYLRAPARSPAPSAIAPA